MTSPTLSELKKRWKEQPKVGTLTEILISRCNQAALGPQVEPSDEGVVTPVDLMKAFVVSGLDCVGATCSGYAAAGCALDAKLKLPLVPGVKLKMDAGATGLKNNLLLLHCLPTSYRAFPPTGVLPAIDSRLRPPPKRPPARSLSNNKIQMLVLAGSWGKVEGTIAAEAGYSVGRSPKGFKASAAGPSDRDREADALGLGIGIKVGADLTVQGQWMALRVSHASAYPTLFEGPLVNNFGRMLTNLDKAEMIKAALVLVETMFDRKDALWTQKHEDTTPRVKQDGTYDFRLDEATAILHNASIAAQKKFRLDWRGNPGAKTFDDQVRSYLSALRPLPGIAPTLDDPNSFVSSTAYGGAGGLAFSAGLSVKGASALQAEALVKGRRAITHLRLQTQRKRLVQTQQTELEYRQMIWGAEVRGRALKALTTQSKLGSADSYNLIVYRSVFVRWLIPDSGCATTVEGTGICFGLSLAVTSLVEIAQLMEADFAVDAVAMRVAEQLRVDVKALREFLLASWFSGATTGTIITVENCLDFFPTDSVLIESSFAAKGEWRLDLTNDDPPTPSDDLLKRFDDSSRPTATTLQSIRARLRAADLRQNSKTLFKLGIPGTKVGLHLRSVSQAGSENLIDLYIHWFDEEREASNTAPNIGSAAPAAAGPLKPKAPIAPNPLCLPNTARTSRNVVARGADVHEFAVPAVVLLHQ